MAAQPPLEPDEIFTRDGVRVQLRAPRRADPRVGDLALVPTALLGLALAPILLPAVTAAAACLVGLAGAATGAGAARRLLGPLPPGAGGPGARRLQVTWTQVELRWTYDR